MIVNSGDMAVAKRANCAATGFLAIGRHVRRDIPYLRICVGPRQHYVRHDNDDAMRAALTLRNKALAYQDWIPQPLRAFQGPGSVHIRKSDGVQVVCRNLMTGRPAYLLLAIKPGSPKEKMLAKGKRFLKRNMKAFTALRDDYDALVHQEIQRTAQQELDTLTPCFDALIARKHDLWQQVANARYPNGLTNPRIPK
jgi:hypothetical protein